MLWDLLARLLPSSIRPGNNNKTETYLLEIKGSLQVIEEVLKSHLDLSRDARQRLVEGQREEIQALARIEAGVAVLRDRPR